MTTHPTDALSRSPGEDDERLAYIERARGWLAGAKENPIGYVSLRDAVALWNPVLAALDDARASKAFWEARFNEAIGILDSKMAELTRLRTTPSSPYLSLPTRRASDVALQIAVDALRTVADWSSDSVRRNVARQALSDIEAIVGPGIVTGEPK